MMESLQQDNQIANLVRSGKKRFNSDRVSVSPSERKLRIQDAISWSVCFGIVALLTGALLFYRMGVTISGITTMLFYFSLAGFLFFTWKYIQLFSSRETINQAKSPHLN